MGKDLQIRLTEEDKKVLKQEQDRLNSEKRYANLIQMTQELDNSENTVQKEIIDHINLSKEVQRKEFLEFELKKFCCNSLYASK